jgi:hypothetical protein
MPLLGIPLALALALGASLTDSHFTMPLTAAHRRSPLTAGRSTTSTSST